MGRRFFLVALAPLLYTLHGFEEHLPHHDCQQRSGQARNEHGAEIEYVPTDIQVGGQPVPARGSVFIVSQHRDLPCVRYRLFPAPATHSRPQISGDDVGDRFSVGVFDRGFAPPGAHVQWATGSPGIGREALTHAGKKSALVFVRNKSTKKLLITRRAQLAQQYLHEVREGVILFDGVIRIIGYINQQCAVQTALLVKIIAFHHGFDQALGPIGEERLQQLELVKFLSWQQGQASRPLHQRSLVLRHQVVIKPFDFGRVRNGAEQYNSRDVKAHQREPMAMQRTITQ